MKLSLSPCCATFSCMKISCLRKPITKARVLNISQQPVSSSTRMWKQNDRLTAIWKPRVTVSGHSFSVGDTSSTRLQDFSRKLQHGWHYHRIHVCMQYLIVQVNSKVLKSLYISPKWTSNSFLGIRHCHTGSLDMKTSTPRIPSLLLDVDVSRLCQLWSVNQHRNWYTMLCITDLMGAPFLISDVSLLSFDASGLPVPFCLSQFACPSEDWNSVTQTFSRTSEVCTFAAACLAGDFLCRGTGVEILDKWIEL